MLGIKKRRRTSPRSHGDRRILVVDDDAELTRIVRRAASIASKDLRVDVATTAQIAREMIETRHYEMVLLDNFLDGDARGIDLVAPVRRSQPGAVIAMMSSIGMEKLVELTSGERKVELLAKPFSAALLRAFLHDVLDLPGYCPAHTARLS